MIEKRELREEIRRLKEVEGGGWRVEGSGFRDEDEVFSRL